MAVRAHAIRVFCFLTREKSATVWAMRVIAKSPSHMKSIAAMIARDAVTQSRKPVILALSGELGSGKTTFVQGIGLSLGIREKIQSPTFVLMKWYRLPKKRAPLRHLIHIDAYRIESLAEARHIGLKHALRDRNAIAVVEWAERIRKLIPRGAIWIEFCHQAKNLRLVEIRNPRLRQGFGGQAKSETRNKSK